VWCGAIHVALAADWPLIIARCIRFSGYQQRRNNMSVTKCLFAGLAASLVMCATAVATYAADEGLITKPSKYSVKETVARFEAAVKQREAAGFIVFTETDHADAAKKFGLDMRPRTVIVFGNPKGGTPAMVKTPLLAIDLPLKALVWEDGEGKVWLSYNSADYLYKTIYPRHGAVAPPTTAPFAQALDEMSDYATK
jgi:uncharacterized protein (DUF302 family)